MARKKGLKKQCLDAVSTVLKRDVTYSEGQEIVNSIKTYYRQLKLQNPSASKSDNIAAAAKLYADQIKREAERIKLNARRQVAALEENKTYFRNQIAQGATPNQAAKRILDEVDKKSLGTKEQYKSGLIDMLEAVHPRFFGLIENSKNTLLLVKQLMGEDSGDEAIRKAAAAYTKVTEEMRQRFNAAGGDIGKIDDWVFPQSHNRLNIIRAGARLGIKAKNAVENKKAWVDYVFERIDKSKYLDDNLTPMGDQDIRVMLNGMYDTITQAGANKIDTDKVKGAPRGSGFINRNSAHRALHFKDAEARIEYNSMFGENPSILGTMLNHIDNLARDITIVENMGPSPNLTFNTIKTMARVQNNQGAARAGKLPSDSRQLDVMWQNLNGQANQVINPRTATAVQGIRNLQIASKLGSAFLTSISDLPTYFHTVGMNKMPFAVATKNLLRSLNPLVKEDKRFLARAGIVGDELNSAMSRFVEGNLGYGLTNKLADLTMRLSFLSQWTNSIRRAQAFNTMGFMSEATKHNWNDMDGWLRRRLENFGLNEEFWKVLQKANKEEFRGAEFITKEGILSISDDQLKQLGISRNRLRQIASDYLSFVVDDTFMASLQPDLYTRSIANMGLQKGSIEGELWRSIMLFKSFPIGMISRHVQRGRDLYRYKIDEKGRVSALASTTGYYVTLIVGTSITGLITNAFKDITNGKDVEDPFTGKAILRAFSTGGGAGFFGDFLVSALDDYKYGHPAVFNLAGPVVSSALDAYTIYDKAKDQKDIGGNVIRFARANLPMVNIWYAKQVINHAIFNQLQEMVSPGYHRRLERRARKEHGVGYWWRPLDMAPNRLPTLGDKVREK